MSRAHMRRAALNALTEAVSTVKSRSILLKQVQYGSIHPSAFVVAQTLADIRSLSFDVSYFHVSTTSLSISNALHLLSGFCVDCVHSLRGWSEFVPDAWSLGPQYSAVIVVAGSAIPVGLLYSGFSPTRPTQHRWGSWLRRASPSPYALEALMGNEFTGITLTCAEVTCGKDQQSVPGSVYLADYFDYTRSHLWRNFGIVLVLWFLYIVLGSIGLTILTRKFGGSQSRIFKRSRRHDEESHPKPNPSSLGSSSTTQTVPESIRPQSPEKDDLTTSSSTAGTFTFQDIS
ncbi:uncharacterized protein BO97DRAFT_428323 [Aspergillus homomorphus CBS 101889]|uniref:Uncharacterized protein n=1 Tax=Aspergillus homomorphus (strain CBS 101889) TaxID=1450537 RepID=A0A395HLY2_ASPHC|nr:hypothetical protein BO97DRAFT_428323 [Aspergillus homomorphus CBS 101889]RAL08499.1 hypothetical protein BO97DRAFT_428323 [Aspergillus homomorphus CBS 101889]